MSGILWFSGGRVIDPANGRDERGDLYVVNGKIVADLSSDQKREAHRIEVENRIVCPGFVDIHVHLREPGQTHKESIATGTGAAAAGGFTTIVCMPNTTPPADNPATLGEIQDIIRREAVVNVFPTGSITMERKGDKLAPIESLREAGAVAITDDGDCVQNNGLMRKALECARRCGLTVMDHCQDSALTEGSVMNEGESSRRTGLRGWPNAAEDIIVSRNAILSSCTGAHVHLQHITSAASVAIIRRAKEDGVALTAEATPHHFSLTDAAIEPRKTNFKMNPPLRTEVDRLALIQGLRDGVIDCIATDHAPHTEGEKDCPFEQAPFGIIGLETALPVSLHALVRSASFALPELIALMTHKPSRVLGLEKGTLGPGADADIVIFDPEEEWTVHPSRLRSRSSNSPWLGETLRGRVKRTFIRGRAVWNGERI